MRRTDETRPTAVIHLGAVPVPVWSTDAGICGLELSRELMNGPETGDIWIEMLSPESTGPSQSRDLELLCSYLKGMLEGRTPPPAPRVDLSSVSEFSRSVLEATAEIPYGQVRSYKWIAEKIGQPKAARAVGGALGRNPVPLVVPCHRIVRSDGSLGGFASGPEFKRWLLAKEKPKGIDRRFVKVFT